jgi:organic hydroperoxide reductase OsmC/OhrA
VLEARGIPADEGRLSAQARGEIEKDGKVLVITRIYVSYQLRVSAEQRETAKRVHGLHADSCPVARSVKDSIEISTELNLSD